MTIFKKKPKKEKEVKTVEVQEPIAADCGEKTPNSFMEALRKKKIDRKRKK